MRICAQSQLRMLPAVTWPTGHPRDCARHRLNWALAFIDVQQTMLPVGRRALSDNENTRARSLGVLRNEKNAQIAKARRDYGKRRIR